MTQSDSPQPVKPALGLMPRYLMEGQRTTAILEAMLRYVNIGQPIPVEWTDELNDLASKRRWRSEDYVPEAPEIPERPMGEGYLIEKIKEIRENPYEHICSTEEKEEHYNAGWNDACNAILELVQRFGDL